jgi:hypothetical protein
MYIVYSVKFNPPHFYTTHAVYVYSVNVCGFFKKHRMMAYLDRNML